jgi:predicted metal-binding membrane protein
MWAVMMVGMMTPSAAPMILIYARLGRQALVADKPFAATGWFVAGYLLAWVGFALAATVAQWALDSAALLDSRMASASNALGGAVLIAAGMYQWTLLKDVCLAKCQIISVRFAAVQESVGGTNCPCVRGRQNVRLPGEIDRAALAARSANF